MTLSDIRNLYTHKNINDQVKTKFLFNGNKQVSLGDIVIECFASDNTNDFLVVFYKGCEMRINSDREFILENYEYDPVLYILKDILEARSDTEYPELPTKLEIAEYVAKSVLKDLVDVVKKKFPELTIMWDAYVSAAVSTRKDSANSMRYLVPGLLAEIGEIADKKAKQERDGGDNTQGKLKEIGDVLWFVANVYQFKMHPKNFNVDPDLFESYIIDYRNILYSDMPAGALNDKNNDILDYYLVQGYLWCVRYTSNSIVGADYDDYVKWAAYMIAVLSFYAKRYDSSLSEIAKGNIEKLKDRQARGVISGSGDDR